MRLRINQALESDILSCTIVRISRDNIAPTWTTDKKKLINLKFLVLQFLVCFSKKGNKIK